LRRPRPLPCRAPRPAQFVSPNYKIRANSLIPRHFAVSRSNRASAVLCLDNISIHANMVYVCVALPLLVPSSLFFYPLVLKRSLRSFPASPPNHFPSFPQPVNIGPHTNRRNSIPLIALPPKRCTPQGVGYRHFWPPFLPFSLPAPRAPGPPEPPALQSLRPLDLLFRRSASGCALLSTRYPQSFHTLAHFFALRKNSSPIVSTSSTLLLQNTRGGYPPLGLIPNHPGPTSSRFFPYLLTSLFPYFIHPSSLARPGSVPPVTFLLGFP